jgi:hypothetical protein
MTDFDSLCKRLDNLVAEIDKQLRHRVTIESHDGDDDDGFDEVSNPSLDASDNDDNPDDYADEADELVENDIEKATINAAQLTNSRSNRPGSLPSSTHPSPQPRPHKFEQLVAAVKNDQGISRTAAQALVRQTYPEVYSHYVGAAGRYFKSAGSALEQEMAKGVTAEIAKVRLINLYGSAAELDRTLTKREETALTAEDALIAKAEDIFQNGELDRCASLRAARKQLPARLLKALQAS